MAETPANQEGIRDTRDRVTGRFVPGVSGNPKGRPKAPDSITDILRSRLAGREDLFDRWIKLCESPDEQVALRALIALANRLDGMPGQKVETSSAADDALAAAMDEMGAALLAMSEKVSE